MLLLLEKKKCSRVMILVFKRRDFLSQLVDEIP